MELTENGYIWRIAAGPTTIRYTAVRQGDGWREIGERVAADGTATLIFEMNLHRIGDTDWPLQGQAKMQKR